MNELPPAPEESDDLGDLYRHAASFDASQPSELVRRRILHHAAQLAAQRKAENVSVSSRRSRAATRGWRRPAIFGTLAAAALAGLLITPRLFTPAPSLPTAAPPAEGSQSPRAAKPESFARNAPPRDTAEMDKAPRQATSGAQPTARLSAASRLSRGGAELRQAAETGDIARLHALLDQETSTEARDESGRTALMLATLNGRSEAVEVLLKHGADPRAADAQGRTPLQVALAAHQRQIVAALQRAGAH